MGTSFCHYSYKIKPGNFVGEYIVDDFSVSSASLPDNVSKLQIDEFIRLSEHQNGRGTNFPENIDFSFWDGAWP